MKKAFFVLLLIITTKANSQVTIIPQMSSLNQFNDLWNVSLVNASGSSLNGSLTVNVSLQNSNAVVVLQTPVFSLNQGINQVPVAAENNAIPQFSSNAYGSYLQTNYAFLAGAYNVCYLLNITTDPAFNTQQCIQLNGSSIAPINLFSPFNTEVIHTLNPDLVWIPPYPSAGLTYNLLLVPYDSTMSFSDNFVLHSPFLYQTNLSGNDLIYPGGGNQLDQGGIYLWKVQASSGGTVVGETESWVFRIDENASESDTIQDCYRILNTDLNNGRYLFDNYLRFAYDNRSNDDTLNLAIRNLSNGAISQSPNTISLSRGINKINLDLSLFGLTTQNDYMLIIIDSDQKTYNFIFRTEN